MQKLSSNLNDQVCIRILERPDVKIKNLYDPKTIFCDDSEFVVWSDQIKRRLRGVVPAQCEIPSRVDRA